MKPKRKPVRQPRDLRGDLSKYPVDPKKIPLNMPAELFHLFTTGHLMAWERQQYGFLPLMMCADCEGIPVDLIWKHKPVSVNHFTSAAIQKRQKSSKRQKPLPGSTWGSDVAVICRCCSFGGKCPHKKAIDALKTVKAGDDWQGVKQGVQR